MKLTFQIRLSRVDEAKSVPAEPYKLVMAGWNGEMGWHLALKLLGFLLFFEQKPRIETGIGWHFKPDLVCLDARGDVELWIDCGNIAVKKIDRVATKVGAPGRFFILKRRRSGARLLRLALQGKVRRPERVTLIAFDDGFVDRLTELLDGTNGLDVELGEESIELQLRNRHGEHVLASGIHRSPVP